MRPTLLLAPTFVLALALAGCASPANFAGNYTIAATDGANDCGFSGWTAGTMSSGTPVVITQGTGASSATMMIGGVAGAYVAVLAGSSTINGTISGSNADFSAPGTASAMMGTCTYQIGLDINAQLSGDVLTGTITLTPSTNHSSACGVLETCHNTITFNGTRPPSM